MRPIICKLPLAAFILCCAVLASGCLESVNPLKLFDSDKDKSKPKKEKQSKEKSPKADNSREMADLARELETNKISLEAMQKKRARDDEELEALRQKVVKMQSQLAAASAGGGRSAPGKAGQGDNYAAGGGGYLQSEPVDYSTGASAPVGKSPAAAGRAAPDGKARGGSQDASGVYGTPAEKSPYSLDPKGPDFSGAKAGRSPVSGAPSAASPAAAPGAYPAGKAGAATGAAASPRSASGQGAQTFNPAATSPISGSKPKGQGYDSGAAPSPLDARGGAAYPPAGQAAKRIDPGDNFERAAAASAPSARATGSFVEAPNGAQGMVMEVQLTGGGREVILDCGQDKGLREGSLIMVAGTSVWQVKRVTKFNAWAVLVQDSPSQEAASNNRFYEVQRIR